jgi:hypothetical protein
VSVDPHAADTRQSRSRPAKTTLALIGLSAALGDVM